MSGVACHIVGLVSLLLAASLVHPVQEAVDEAAASGTWTLGEIESLVVGEGTIYPILNRFKREALVRTTIEESPDGPPRKYYELTDKGRTQLERMNEHWQRLLHGIENLRKELA